MEIELPEEIIQYIQSLLNIKEAARTSVLSKLWYSALCNGQILSFDIRGLRKRDYNIPITDMQRYKESNLKLDRFMLIMSYTGKSRLTTLVDNLIVDALNLGVNELELKVPIFNIYKKFYNLPPQVFEAISLTKLSLDGCDINQSTDGRAICCSHLISLSLHYVGINGSILRDIVNGCPFIEYFDVCICPGDYKIDVSKLHNLKRLSIKQHDYCRVMFGQPTNTPNFCKLSCLYLDSVCFDDRFFFNKLSSMFPCIGDLAVTNCEGYDYEELEISCHSVKWLTLIMRRDKIKNLQLDIPNIVKFRYESNIINPPYLSLTSTHTKDWESDLAFGNDCDDSAYEFCRFLELRNFLSALVQSNSRITSLHLISSTKTGDSPLEDLREVPCVSLPKVENLMLTKICQSGMYHPFLEGLFRSCRPKFITQTNNDIFEVVEAILNEHLDSEKGIAFLHDLKEVKFEEVQSTGLGRLRLSWDDEDAKIEKGLTFSDKPWFAFFFMLVVFIFPMVCTWLNFNL